MSNLLTLEDAVAVCMRLLHETNYFDNMPMEEYETIPELIESEFEQKCWIANQKNDALKELNDLIFDINPAEIASQIRSDNLRQWCQIMQVEMKMALVRIPLRDEAR